MSEFKMTKVFTKNVKEVERAQKAMFQLGFRWAGHTPGTPRKMMNSAGYCLCIFVDVNCDMRWTSDKYYTDPDKHTEVSIEALEFAAAEHCKFKQAHKKASRKRKQFRKQGWTLNTTGVCPVSDNNKIEVLFNNGSTGGGTGNIPPSKWWWGIDATSKASIKAYRVIPTQAKQFSDALKQLFSKPAVQAWKNKSDSSVLSGGEWKPDIKVATAVDTNPKRQFGMKSIPLNLWSPLASAYGALGLYNGSLKYGRGNYKATKVEASIYIAAAMRHMAAWAEGEENDPSDDVPNLAGVLANIAIILDARAAGTLIDDRQLPGGYLKERAALEKVVTSLQKLHEGKSPRHYSIKDTI